MGAPTMVGTILSAVSLGHRLDPSASGGGGALGVCGRGRGCSADRGRTPAHSRFSEGCVFVPFTEGLAQE